MKRKLISIITIVFNGAEYLEQAILSVLNQTYKNLNTLLSMEGLLMEVLKL
jgi:glycosyltransferase involved in cell wall biosynthesis